jgi:tetratricopeptide (TPR) repeat protein
VGEYDTAAQVLSEINFDYLLLWGHTRLLIEQHERMQGKLSDLRLKQNSVGNLGSAYYSIGQVRKAIVCYEQAVALARETKNRIGEGAWLSNLGNCYADLGETRRTIELYEQALAIAREIGDRRGEGTDLGNLGSCYADLGETRRAIELYEQALAIAREIGDRQGEGIRLGNLGNCYANLSEIRRAIELYKQALAIAREIGDAYDEGCTLAYLCNTLTDERRYVEAIRHAQASIQIGTTTENLEVCSEGHAALALAQLGIGDLPSARATAEQARHYNYRPRIAPSLALLGVIAVRQGESAAAHAAFTAARSHAEEALAITPELYRMQDTLALALAGLGEIENARIAYQAARAITSDPGIVQRAAFLMEQVGVGM